jgi:hypothetical protein
MGPLRPQSFRGERMPSGWLTGSEGKHFCTICSPSAVSRFLRR